MTPMPPLTVQDLIDALQQYPPDMPLIVNSYEVGYDPVTHLETTPIAHMPDREWYQGIYERADTDGKPALLIASRYYKTESDDT